MQELRARQWMYVQYFKYLPFKINNLTEILTKDNCQEWAYIVHDKDTKEDGSLISPHVHVLIKYSNPQTLKHVANLFKDKPQYFDIWKGRINNSYSYLIHSTSEAINKGKYKYSPNEVVASFDFSKRIEKIQRQVLNKKIKSNNSNLFIEKYAEGEISYNDLENIIGVVQVARHKTIIDHINQINASNKHKEWLKSFKGKPMETHWLWGAAGVGKTRYAKWLAKNDKVAILGSSRDYFQEYHGEHIVILNDLRPNDFNYGDLLRLLDPYEHNKMAPRRYHDVYLNLEMLIITTPYSPWSFYKQCKIDNPEVDTYKQLNRRVHAVHVTKDFISDIVPYEFNMNFENLGFE